MSTPNPWPRGGVHKVHDRDGNVQHVWFVPSASAPGAFRKVSFHGEVNGDRYFTCSCPGGHYEDLRMGSKFERACRHVREVLAAERDDGLPPRPVSRPAVSALVD